MRYRFILMLLLSGLASVRAETPALLPGEPFPLQQPYTLTQLRAWHAGWDSRWPWHQQELSLHLRADNSEQLLLASYGYSRGGEYVLFINRNGDWQANAQTIELAHHPVQVLPATRDGWHDFETYVPAWGSGGAEVWVFHYRWNGEAYEQAGQRDAKWCELRYFRETAALCATP